MSQIVVCGNYGAGNRGDEAILRGLLSLIHSLNPESTISVMTGNKTSTEALIQKLGLRGTTLKFIPTGIRSLCTLLRDRREFKTTLSAIKNADLCILGGGGLLSDQRGLKAMWIWWVHAMVMRKFGKKLIFLSQSFNKPITYLGTLLLRHSLTLADIISVRDNVSQTIVKELVPQASVEIASDLAMVSEIDYCARKNPPSATDKYVAINMRYLSRENKVYEKALVNFITKLCNEHEYKAVLCGFGSEIIPDSKYMNTLFKSLIADGKCMLLDENVDEEIVMDTIVNANFAVGMRLHFNIFALKSCVPYISISYDDKVKNFMSMLDLKEFNIHIDELTLDKLIEKWQEIELYHDKYEEIISMKKSQYQKRQEVDIEILRSALGLGQDEAKSISESTENR